MFNQGQKVNTPKGTGIVVYIRMAPPDWNNPKAVSVFLDARRNDYNYSGTIFPAEQVKPAE